MSLPLRLPIPFERLGIAHWPGNKLRIALCTPHEVPDAGSFWPVPERHPIVVEPVSAALSATSRMLDGERPFGRRGSTLPQ